MGKALPEHTIRIMGKPDVPAVAAVEADAFPSPWPAKLFDEEMANPFAVYLVLEVGGQVCGYAGFWLVLGEAQITNIALLSGLRGCGLGKRLVAAMLEAAAALGAQTAFLEVRQSNNRAQHIYAGLGFSGCGLRTGYYQDNGENAVLMRKDIAAESNHE